MITEELEKKLKISKNTGIHCPTLELAKQVSSIFHQLGLKWCDGTSYIPCNSWDMYDKRTVYHPFDGERSFLEFARETGYEIIRAEDFIALHTEEKEFNSENYEAKGDLTGSTEQLEKKLKISKNTCIHCPTLELAIQVLSIFHQSGLRWKSETHYTVNNNWDSFKESTVYYPFRGECSSYRFANLTGYIIIRAEEFIALHTEAKEFDLENYVPKGALKGFPKEIIAKMLDSQEEQGNKRDISVFEKCKTVTISNGGFYWLETKEGTDFWNKVLLCKNFDLFFKRYPKNEEIKVCSNCKECRKISLSLDNTEAVIDTLIDILQQMKQRI